MYDRFVLIIGGLKKIIVHELTFLLHPAHFRVYGILLFNVIDPERQPVTFDNKGQAAFEPSSESFHIQNAGSPETTDIFNFLNQLLHVFAERDFCKDMDMVHISSDGINRAVAVAEEKCDGIKEFIPVERRYRNSKVSCLKNQMIYVS